MDMYTSRDDTHNGVDDVDSDDVLQSFLRYTTQPLTSPPRRPAVATTTSAAVAAMTATVTTHTTVQREQQRSTTTRKTKTARVAATLPTLRTAAPLHARHGEHNNNDVDSDADGGDDDDNDKHDDAADAPSCPVQWQQVLPRLTGGRGDAARVLRLIFAPRVVSTRTTTQQQQSDDHDDVAHEQDDGDNGVVQYVSTQPSSREDVAALHRRLQQRLQTRRARADGVCAIRRDVYDDVFAELVRQLTVEEPAQGVLLQRIRDELQQQLRVHAQLLRRARGVAVRGVLDSPHELPALRDRLAVLDVEKAALLTQRHTLEERLRQLERRITEERVRRSKECQDELAYLRRANQQLSMRLKSETERASVLTTTTTTATTTQQPQQQQQQMTT